jgi:cytochrome P450
MQRVPPAPKGHFLLGNIPEFSQDSLKFMLDLRAYGDLASYKFGPYRGYIVNHPDLAHDLLVTHADKTYKNRGLKRALDPILGAGLFTSEGDFWKRQRKLVQPAFHTRRIGAYAETMVEYAQDAIRSWNAGETVEVDLAMNALTMRIIAKTLFDADVNAEAREAGEAVATVLEDVNERLNQIVPLPRWVPTPKNRRFYAAVDRLDRLIQRFIDERRKSGDDKGDLLSMLLMAQDADDGGVMTDKQVRDEAMTLFGAGHETTAVAMTWTWYLLSQHPEVEAKLHAELDSVLAGRAPTLADLPRLPYTEMVLKESMRLYPPAFTVIREVTAPFTLGGYDFKPGRVIIVNIYGIHRDARFFPDPERFDPERFTPENEKRLPKYAYFPFGGGPRICIGNAFAMMEATLLLATIAQRWTLRLAPGQVVEPQRKFTIRPKYGMKMIAEPRQPAFAPATAGEMAV